MPLTDEELEQRYRSTRNPAIQDVGRARTPNNAKPVDEGAILDFVKRTEGGHAAYVRKVFKKYSLR